MGSERIKQTRSDRERNRVPAKCPSILRGIAGLQSVVEALSRGQRHVPYRDCKLTRLFKNAFGGNCRTTLIVTVSPHRYNREQTIRSMRFAMAAMKIQNNAVVK